MSSRAIDLDKLPRLLEYEAIGFLVTYFLVKNYRLLIRNGII